MLPVHFPQALAVCATENKQQENGADILSQSLGKISKQLKLLYEEF